MNKKNAIIISILLVILILIAILDIFEVIGLPCIFHDYLNIWCPGCGTTRMIRSLLHFEFYQAFRYNPLVFILLFPFGATILAEIIYFIKNKRLFNISNKIYIVLLFILLIYMVLRNIPYLSWLTPTVIK